MKVGDLVTLKSGGPNLTVRKIDGNNVICTWFNDVNFIDDEFNLETLVFVKSESNENNLSNIEQFKKEVISAIDSNAAPGALAGLFCADSNALSSSRDRYVGARLYPLQEKYGVKIVGVSYNGVDNSLHYLIKNLETEEVDTIQII